MSVVLGLASLPMAVAQGHAAGVTEVMACTGAGVVAILLDAEGNPNKASHPCPECLAGGLLAVLPVQPSAPGMLAAGQRLTVRDPASVELSPLICCQARGPPALV